MQIPIGPERSQQDLGHSGLVFLRNEELKDKIKQAGVFQRMNKTNYGIGIGTVRHRILSGHGRFESVA